jgi:GNAT superfamily N-acetyltransferase
MQTEIVIREMSSDDLAFAASCTTGEGWASEDLSCLESFFLKDPQGCLVAEENGRSIGICIATCFGKSGFIGELIVIPEARGKGIGASLLNHGVTILKDRGVETVYLDGVLKAVQLYERNGFRKICRSWRFSGCLPGATSYNVRRMVFSDLEQVSAFDQMYFGEDRSFFIKRRFELFPELSHVQVEGQQITGYILGRNGPGWISAGPWVVNAEMGNPIDLLSAFSLEGHGESISVGVLDTNLQACKLLGSMGFVVRPDSPWRMALGPASHLGTAPQCMAIGSAAKG